MNGLAFDLLKIRELLQRPRFEIHVKSEWGTDNPGFREAIKQDIKSKSFEPHQVSISHSKIFGGYIADPEIPRTPNSSAANAIGFDLEITERVSREIAMRVSLDADEFSKAPASASLWTAKEACFKALRGPHQPQVLSQLLLGDWKYASSSQIETVKLLSVAGREASSIGFGVVIHQDFLTFCFFSLRD